MMEIHYPTFGELREMDELLLDIKDKSFQMQICIRDKHEVNHKKGILLDQLKEKNLVIEQLRKLVERWSYVPLSAACYLKDISIKSDEDEVTTLMYMDELILRIQKESLQLRKYKRENKRDAGTLCEIQNAEETKRKLLERLRDLTITWDYVPMCTTDLLEQLDRLSDAESPTY